MDCKPTSIKRRLGGYTLMEFVIATGLGGLILAVTCSLAMYGARSFSAMANYLSLDLQSQQTLDTLSREIREADHITSFATNDLVFVNNSGSSVEYQFNTNTSSVIRITGGATNTLLTDCNSLTFSIYQRTPISNTFEPNSTTSYTNAKLVEINWHCSGTILGVQANTESIQSAKVVIRNH